jgi:hypothetical protein
MKHRIERSGKTLREQQIDLCEEWRKANTAPILIDSPWEKEVRDFHGDGSLSGDAWAQLQKWWRNHRDSN